MGRIRLSLAVLCMTWLGCTNAQPTMSASPAADGMSAEPPASFRACVEPKRDARGGFCDATERWGASYSLGRTSERGHPGGTITAADFDGDGHVDLLILPHIMDDSPILFLRREDRFEDATAAWGLAGVNHVSVAAAADFDGDGDPDLALGGLDQRVPVPVRLLRNEGGRFAPEATVLGGPVDAIVLAAEDLDHDGLLDLLVARFTQPDGCERGMFDDCPGGVMAWRQSAPWRFEPVPVTATPRYAQALRVFDIDRDGRDDVLVGADYGMLSGANQVLRVEAGPEGLALREETTHTGFEQGVFAMGIAALDVDGDVAREVVVSNFGRNVLLTRRGSTLEDVAERLGAGAYGLRLGDAPAIPFFDPEHPWMGPLDRFTTEFLDGTSEATPTTKWTPVVFDYDDDGVDDLYVASGEVGIGIFPEAADQSGVLLRGTGRRLEDVTRAAGLFERYDARAAAAVDLDGDGDLDLALFHTSNRRRPGGLRLLRNDASTGRSLTVVARGRGGARDGVGATVTVRVGARSSRHRVDGNLSIYGSVPPEVHAGLGSAGLADEVTVRFPSGVERRLEAVPAGRVVIEE